MTNRRIKDLALQFVSGSHDDVARTFDGEGNKADALELWLVLFSAGQRYAVAFAAAFHAAGSDNLKALAGRFLAGERRQVAMEVASDASLPDTVGLAMNLLEVSVRQAQSFVEEMRRQCGWRTEPAAV